MPNLVLTCSGLIKHFQQGDTRVEVLKGVDLAIAAGERIAIVGASGSGKTTLLQLLGGLDLPTSGTVSIAGKEINLLSDAARGELRNRALGFVYQFHHLLPEFTALENVAMPLLIRRMPVAEARRRRERCWSASGSARGSIIGQGNCREANDNEQPSRARWSRNRPSCWPTSRRAISTARTRSQVFELMLELNRELQTALVIVTHAPELATRMQRTLTLTDGRLSGSG